MWMIKGIVVRHFIGKVPYMVEKNLSRLTSQWTESINAAMAQAGKVAEQRLDELVGTVERLTTSGSSDAPVIREDLNRINSVLNK
jgi:6,7-dimethyl-8-ribityllumazine synthase